MSAAGAAFIDRSFSLKAAEKQALRAFLWPGHGALTVHWCPAAGGHLRLCPPPLRPLLGEEKGKAARPVEEGRRRNRCSGPSCGLATGV